MESSARRYLGSAVNDPLFDGVYFDACGPQAPPTRQANYPCPGRGSPNPEPPCKYPRALDMSAGEVARYYTDANAAFARAEAMIRAAGKWSTTWVGETFHNETCCRGCKPECRPATPAECVGSVVGLVDAASRANHTLQLRVPLPAWTETNTPPFSGTYLEWWVALFLLVRGPSASLYFPGQGGALNYAKDYPWDADAINRDYGVPLEGTPTLGAAPNGGLPLSVFTRRWSNANVTFDCATFEARIHFAAQ